MDLLKNVKSMEIIKNHHLFIGICLLLLPFYELFIYNTNMDIGDKAGFMTIVAFVAVPAVSAVLSAYIILIEAICRNFPIKFKVEKNDG
jgi:hypothetical protein